MYTRTHMNFSLQKDFIKILKNINIINAGYVSGVITVPGNSFPSPPHWLSPPVKQILTESINLLQQKTLQTFPCFLKSKFSLKNYVDLYNLYHAFIHLKVGSPGNTHTHTHTHTDRFYRFIDHSILYIQ